MAFTLLTGYTNNTSTLIDNQDYGIKISKAGYGALKANDNDLLFNSSWPSLQIIDVYDYAYPGGFPSSFTSPIEHGLPFVPLAAVFGRASVDLDGAGLIDSISSFEILDVNEQYVYPNSAFMGFDAGEFKVVVFNVNITKDIEYPYTDNPSVFSGYSQDYGIKVAKEDADTSSDDLRDYTLHSRAQSPLLLAVKTQSTIPASNTAPDGSKIMQYTSPLESVTYSFGFVEFTGPPRRYVYAPYQAQAYPVLYSNGIISQLNIVTGSSVTGNASIVVLRSPMFATEDVYNVTY